MPWSPAHCTAFRSCGPRRPARLSSRRYCDRKARARLLCLRLKAGEALTIQGHRAMLAAPRRGRCNASKEEMVAAQFDSYYPISWLHLNVNYRGIDIDWTNVASMQHSGLGLSSAARGDQQSLAIEMGPPRNSEAGTLLRAPASPGLPPIHQRDRWQKIAASQIDSSRRMAVHLEGDRRYGEHEAGN
jgi:hypothetical protein